MARRKRIVHTEEQTRALNVIMYGEADPQGNTYDSRRNAWKAKILHSMGVTYTAKPTTTFKVPLAAKGQSTMDGVIIHKGTLEYVPLKWTLIQSRSIFPENKGINSSEHRLFVDCPYCGTQTPVGRIHQHVGTKTCEKADYKRQWPWKAEIGNVVNEKDGQRRIGGRIVELGRDVVVVIWPRQQATGWEEGETHFQNVSCLELVLRKVVG